MAKAALSLISTKDIDKMLTALGALYEQITGKKMTEAEIAEATAWFNSKQPLVRMS